MFFDRKPFAHRLRGLALSVSVSLSFAAQAQSPPASAAVSAPEGEQGAPVAVAAPIREQMLLVPLTTGHGKTVYLHARMCLPDGKGPATLVLINHGSPPDASVRPKMTLGRCDQEAAQWFLTRGYVVAFVLRRGYGETGGDFAEGSSGCNNPDFVHAGLETARDIDAAVQFLTRLPEVKPGNAVVVGQSAGGWGAIAYASVAPPQVAAFVVMAGGRGGHRDNVAHNNCRPDLLAEAAGHFGKTARTPMLWIYTENDSYFAPWIARAMHHAFAANGGVAELKQPGPYDTDGHKLFFGPGGSAVWGPLVEQYLAARHVAAAAFPQRPPLKESAARVAWVSPGASGSHPPSSALYKSTRDVATEVCASVNWSSAVN
jgi:dienelactone hydrolase